MYKRIVVLVTIIALLGIYVFWGMDYIYALAWDKSAPERDTLVNELENTKKRLSKRIVVDENLPQEVEQARQELEAEMEKVPVTVDIPGLIDEMLQLADEIGIEIIPLRTSSWSGIARAGYEGYQIQILVAGDASAITNYVDRLEASGPFSLITSDLQLQGEAIGRIGQTWEVQGSLTVSIYRRIDPGAES